MGKAKRWIIATAFTIALGGTVYAQIVNPVVTIRLEYPLAPEVTAGVARTLQDSLRRVGKLDGELPPLGIGEILLPKDAEIKVATDLAPWKSSQERVDGKLLEFTETHALIEMAAGNEWIERSQLVRLEDLLAHLEWKRPGQADERSSLLATAVLSAVVGRLDVAVERLNTLVHLEPKTEAYLLMRGRMHWGLGNREAALRDLDAALALPAPSALSYLTRGQFLVKLDRNDEAVADFDACLKRDETCVPALYGRASVHFDGQRFEPALADCNRALALDADHWESLALRGYIRLKRKEYEAAIPDYSRMIELRPNAMAALLQRTRLYLECEKPELARKDLVAVAAHPCDDITTLCVIAATWSDLNDERQSKEFLGRAADLPAETDKDLHMRAMARFQVNRLDSAIADCNAILERSNADVLALYCRLSCFVEKKELKPALADANRLVQLKPGDESMLAARRQLWRMRDDWEAAAGELTASLERSGPDAEALVTRGLIYWQHDRFDDAVGDFLAAVNADPKHAYAGAMLAWFLVACSDKELRNPEAGMHALLRVLRLAEEPHDWDSILQVIGIFEKAGDLTRAIRLQQAVVAREIRDEKFRGEQRERLVNLERRQALESTAIPLQNFEQALPRPAFPGADDITAPLRR